MVKVLKPAFFLLIFLCIGYGLYISYVKSKGYDPSGRPSISHLKKEIAPFSDNFGGVPITAFDRVSIVGVSSQGIRLANKDSLPLVEFKKKALSLGWVESTPTKSPYSRIYNFCKKRLMLSLEQVENSYWTYGVIWTSDSKSEHYCNRD